MSKKGQYQVTWGGTKSGNSCAPLLRSQQLYGTLLYMLVGPVFTREVTIAPRREWTYILRSVYVGLLLLLIVTAWLVISGTQLITDPGDFARFGTMLFQFLAPMQLVLAILQINLDLPKEKSLYFAACSSAE